MAAPSTEGYAPEWLDVNVPTFHKHYKANTIPHSMKKSSANAQSSGAQPSQLSTPSMVSAPPSQHNPLLQTPQSTPATKPPTASPSAFTPHSQRALLASSQ